MDNLDTVKVGCDVDSTSIEETIADEAQRIVLGARNADYGRPLDDFASLGRLWGAAIGRWLHQPDFPDIPPEIASLMMVLLKVNREINKPKRDNRVDQIGYVLCTDWIMRDKEAAK